MDDNGDSLLGSRIPACVWPSVIAEFRKRNVPRFIVVRNLIDRLSKRYLDNKIATLHTLKHVDQEYVGIHMVKQWPLRDSKPEVRAGSVALNERNQECSPPCCTRYRKTAWEYHRQVSRLNLNFNPHNQQGTLMHNTGKRVRLIARKQLDFNLTDAVQKGWITKVLASQYRIEWLMVWFSHHILYSILRRHIPVSARIGSVRFQATGRVPAVHRIHCILCIFPMCGSAYTTLPTLNVFNAWLDMRTHVVEHVDSRV